MNSWHCISRTHNTSGWRMTCQTVLYWMPHSSGLHAWPPKSRRSLSSYRDLLNSHQDKSITSALASITGSGSPIFMAAKFSIWVVPQPVSDDMLATSIMVNRNLTIGHFHCHELRLATEGNTGQWLLSSRPIYLAAIYAASSRTYFTYSQLNFC